MTSKEIVLSEIKRLEHNLKICEKENMTTQIEYAKTNIKFNELILKDLEELEKYRKVMCNPIAELMNDLEILVILKKILNNSFLCLIKNKEEQEKVKRWLDGKD